MDVEKEQGLNVSKHIYLCAFEGKDEERGEWK